MEVVTFDGDYFNQNFENVRMFLMNKIENLRKTKCSMTREKMTMDCPMILLRQ